MYAKSGLNAVLKWIRHPYLVIADYYYEIRGLGSEFLTCFSHRLIASPSSLRIDLSAWTEVGQEAYSIFECSFGA
ncbi:MAG: hypothetical protein AAF483_22885 [Planctomycetota bacterium]